jgi:hypothetical protein
MPCAICQKRKPKRHCPGVHGEICSLCCGTERENSVTCPLDCPYLQEAHRYEWERNPGAPLDGIPYSQYEIHDNFLYHHDAFIGMIATTLLKRALELPAVQDSDLREALDGLIRTRETLASGLYYESIPPAPVPEALFRTVQQFLEETAAKLQVKEPEIVKCLVFLTRLAAARNNGRSRCRAFLGFLRKQFPEVVAETSPGGLIVSA